MTRCSYLSLPFLLLLLTGLWLLAGCSSGGDGDGDTDGDSCNCDSPLICEAGVCNCPAEIPDCCVDSTWCDPGKTCDAETHRCVGCLGVDCDGDLSGDGDDIPPDGDPDQDVEDCEGEDCPLDGDEDGDEDGDTCEGEECDPDGDDEVTDGDAPQRECLYGVEKLTRIEDLPYFTPTSVTKQFSSRDPREGNDDMITQNLFLEGSDHVIMHSKLPGCIYRIWLGKPSQINGLRIKFYFNGELTPSLNMMMPDFFASGNEDPASPFLPPLVGELSESYYSYVPICYSSEIKVAITGLTQGYQITYQDHSDCANLVDFSMEQDVSGLVDFYSNHLGEDPKAFAADANPIYNTAIDAGNSDVVLENYIPNGDPGRSINAILLDFAPVSDDVLNNAWIEIYWDGKDERTEPDINAPLGMFFGSGYGEMNYSNLMYGMATDGNYYSYWPMPYWKQAIVKINNKSATDIQQLSIEFEIGFNDYPIEETGHFRARYVEEMPTDDDLDFKALEEGGMGHVVGLTLAMEGLLSTEKRFLEGDERIFIENMNFPLVRGTGTDNYFSGNELWRTDPYDSPLFSVWKDSNPNFMYTARRLMIGDSIAFNRGVSFGFEHGGSNDINGNYRSVVYYYSTCLEGMALTDSVCLAVTDPSRPCAENNHDFNTQLPANVNDHRLVSGSYEGENHEDVTFDDGHGILSLSANRGYMAMTVAIRSDNVGVRLIRKLSHKLKNGSSISNQDALVFIGDPFDEQALLKEVGHWYTPGQNIHKNWQESIFDIPAAYTSGKTEVKLLFEHAGGTEWNMFDLAVYSIVPLSGSSEGPGQVQTMDYEVVGLKPCLTWDPPDAGVPPAYYHVYRSATQAFDCDEEHYVATTESNTWCEEDSLPANSQFYYRIKAEDCTGLRGICSDKFLVETGLPPFCMEAESVYNGELSSPKESISPDYYVIRSSTDYSNNALLEFRAENPLADRLILRKEPADPENPTVGASTHVPHTGVYQVQLTVLKGPNMGIFRFSVDGLVMGDVDLYAFDEGLETITLGSTSLDEGVHSFIMRVLDPNNPASTGYYIDIDQICLLGSDGEGE